MENQQEEKKEEKGRRLTVIQAVILMVVGFFGSRFIGAVFNTENVFILAFNTMLEIVGIYGLISIFTKKGLRWR